MIKIYNQNKKKIAICLYFVLLVSWLYFIFSNSLSTGEESTAQSQKVVEISQKIVSMFDEDAVVDPSDVRTSAHFIEFFVLGLIYVVGTFFFEKNRAFLIASSASLSLFTALIDETLQMHVEGRGSQVIDIWVDFLGAVAAHFLVIFIVYFIKLKRIKQR